jgi:hypothetical protein
MSPRRRASSSLLLTLRCALPGLFALAAPGCGPADPCAEQTGTCLSVRLVGEGEIALDRVQVELSGPVAHRFGRDVPHLPALLPIALADSVQGEVRIMALGLSGPTATARGELLAQVSPGSRQSLELKLAPYSCPAPCLDPTTGPMPSLLTPSSGPSGGGTVVRVGGLGFLPDLKVLFGGLLAPVVKWRSATEADAVTPPRPGQLGPVEVMVQNADGQQGRLPAAFRYFAEVFDVEPKPEIKLPAGSSAAFSLALGDFDGDGKLDAVTGNRDSATLTLLYGKGDGTFENPANLMGNELNRPGGVAVLDANGDQKLDLAVASEGVGAVLLYLGSGTRAPFQTNTAGMMALRIPFAGVAGVTVGDYENDGRTDLFVFSNTGNLIAVAPNKGPSFGQPSFDDPNAANNKDAFEKPVALVTSDLDQDSRDDAIAIGQPGANKDNLIITLSKSGGAKKAHRAACVLAGVAVADFDGDGKKDIAATCNDTGQIVTWKGRGGVELEAPAYLRTGLTPHAIAAGDLDLDGRPDLAVTMKRYGTTVEAQDPDSSLVYFLLNDGKGGFRPPQSAVVGRGPAALAIAELDRDPGKRPDLIVSSAYGTGGIGLLSVLLNTAR